MNQYDGIKDYRPHLVNENKVDFVDVETVPLDEFFGGKTQLIDVIKMDVEGAEMLALLGMDRIIRENQNLKMFIEFFPF